MNDLPRTVQRAYYLSAYSDQFEAIVKPLLLATMADYAFQWLTRGISQDYAYEPTRENLTNYCTALAHEVFKEAVERIKTATTDGSLYEAIVALEDEVYP